MKKVRRLLTIFVALFILWFIGLFHPIANMHFLVEQGGALQLGENLKVKELYEDDEVSIRKVYLQRNRESKLKRTLDFINPPRVHLFTFKNSDGNFSIGYHETRSTARKELSKALNFSINSSFYDKEMNTLGEVVVKGQNFGQHSNSSGFFKVIEGKAYAGPRSLFEGLQGTVEYSCQAHPSVMKEGIIWPYILEESMNQRHWKRRTLRNLSGMDANGNIMFLVSGDGGLLSVKEMSELALRLGIRTATLFDAGSALQYSFKKNGYMIHFSAYNNRIQLNEVVHTWFKEKTGYRFFNSSPVFINYKAS